MFTTRTISNPRLGSWDDDVLFNPDHGHVHEWNPVNGEGYTCPKSNCEWNDKD